MKFRAFNGYVGSILNLFKRKHDLNIICINTNDNLKITCTYEYIFISIAYAHCALGFDIYVTSLFGINAIIFLVTLHLTNDSLRIVS